MHIVLIEQDHNTASTIKNYLVKWGFGVYPALNPDQAAGFLYKDPRADMIIYHRTKTNVNDSNLFKAILEERKNHYIYFVLLHSSSADIGSDPGDSELIDDTVTKPLDYSELHARITLGARIVNMENELNQKYSVIKRNYYQIIQIFDQLMHGFDASLGEHCRRVGTIALELAQIHPDIKVTDYPVIEASAKLHDIGFIGLPTGLIDKCRTSMTGDDLKHYLTHPERGEAILSQIDFFKPVAQIVRQHHEQYNGRGFPDNITDDNISLQAQVVSAASLYDYLLHIEQIPLASLAESLQQLRGYQLSPQIVNALLEVHLRHLQKESLQNDKSVSLSDLKEGMVLSRDVLMRSGAFFMPAGHRLDLRAIEKLLHYSTLGNINDTVFIYK